MGEIKGTGRGGRRPGAGRKPLSPAMRKLRGTIVKLRKQRDRAQASLRHERKARGTIHDAAVEEVIQLANEIAGANAQEPPPSPVPPQAHPPADASVDIAKKIQDVYDEIAPLATAAGTLSNANRLAFRDLCETIVMKREMFGRILKDGMMTAKGSAHPLLPRYSALTAQVQAGLDKFKLSAGDGEPPEDEEDEFSEFEEAAS